MHTVRVNRRLLQTADSGVLGRHGGPPAEMGGSTSTVPIVPDSVAEPQPFARICSIRCWARPAATRSSPVAAIQALPFPNIRAMPVTAIPTTSVAASTSTMLNPDCPPERRAYLEPGLFLPAFGNPVPAPIMTPRGVCPADFLRWRSAFLLVH